MQPRKNPSVLRSEERIIEALIDLMQVKPLNRISISEITENAELTRRTFYRHFETKEQVLDAYFERLLASFCEEINAVGQDLELRHSVRILFHLCFQNKEFFLALARSGMQGYMLRKWNEVLPHVHALYADTLKRFPKTSSETALAYLLTFNSGGVYNIVMKWIEDGMTLSPDELADLVMEFAF